MFGSNELYEQSSKKYKRLSVFFVVISWFASTLILLSLNKILMRKGSKFQLPIFLAFLHMCAVYLCCEFIIFFKHRRLLLPIYTDEAIGSSEDNAPVSVIPHQQLPTIMQLWKLFLLSQTFALSIVAAVASLEYVEVSFEQAIAACTPAVTAFLGILILRKKESWQVWLSLSPVILGGFVTAQAEQASGAKGLVLVLISIIARAVKSCL